LGAIKPLLNTAIDGINAIIKGYNAVQWGKDVPLIPKIGGGSGSTATGPLGNFSMSTGRVQTTPTTTVPTAISTGGVGGGGTTSSGIATAARIAASAATTVTSGSFDPGRFRMAENVGMTTINLNVSGAFDREGTARTIVETLNDSFYRGTGGGTSLQMA